MNIEEFVCESISQVMKGVKKAQVAASGIQGIVSHHNNSWAIGGGGDFDTCTNRVVHEVHFDIAVTASESESKGGKAGLKIFSVGVGVSAQGGSENSSVSRIQFSVPVSYPGQENVSEPGDVEMNEETC